MAGGGGVGEVDGSGAQLSGVVGSRDGTGASGTKMVCEVQGLEMIWRDGQAELKLPEGATDAATKQVPANTRVCLVGSMAGADGGHDLIPADAAPEGYGGAKFDFELHAKSMIVTEESTKPSKLATWWLELPENLDMNADAVYFHHAALDGDQKFKIPRTPLAENPFTWLLTIVALLASERCSSER